MTTKAEVILSDEQRAVVESDRPAIVVRASAGTGKTEVVAQRIERLLREGRGHGRILALTYTVKAANEMRNRFRARLGDIAGRIDTGTVHSFAHDLLRRHGTWIGLPVEPEVLATDGDRVELLGEWMEGRGRRMSAEALRNDLMTLDAERAAGRIEHPLHKQWDDALAASGALDYGAMLDRATQLLRIAAFSAEMQRLYDHVIVDEAQNLTPAQYTLVTTLLGEPPLVAFNAAMVGDPNQAMFGFAGADAGCMTRFADMYDAVELPLTQNYRSAEAIVLAGELVARALGRSASPTTIRTYAAPGRVKFVNFVDEAAEGRGVAAWVHQLLDHGMDPDILAPGERTAVQPEEIAVLARSATAQRETKAALDTLGVEWTSSVSLDGLVVTELGMALIELIEMRSTDHPLPRRRLAARLGLAADAGDETMKERLKSIEGPLAGLRAVWDATTPQRLIDSLPEETTAGVYWDGDRLQLIDTWERYTLESAKDARGWAAFRMHLGRLQRGNDNALGVRVLSIHKAQGREYRAVAVVGLNDGQLPDFRASTAEEQREELSIFYVAVSRPTRQLLLSRPESRHSRRGPWRQTPSTFLDLVRPATR